MEPRIHDHFRETQCMVIVLEKSVTYVVRISKISSAHGTSPQQWRVVLLNPRTPKMAKPTSKSPATAANHARPPYSRQPTRPARPTAAPWLRSRPLALAPGSSYKAAPRHEAAEAIERSLTPITERAVSPNSKFPPE
jgi:hypothetical protein